MKSRKYSYRELAKRKRAESVIYYLDRPDTQKPKREWFNCAEQYKNNIAGYEAAHALLNGERLNLSQYTPFVAELKKRFPNQFIKTA